MLSGCGSLYETNYSYIKPNSPQGVICTVQCENTRLQCVQNKELEKQNCETNKRLDNIEYDQCVAAKGKDKCSRNWTYCSADTSSCKTAYNNCYTACGGQVKTERVCVANCDKR
jgi:hypothetical protein